MSAPNDNTVAMVPLRELTDLARIGLAMLGAQRLYFEKRKATPHVPATSELRAAQLLEKRFRAAAESSLNRERVSLPGMGEEGGAPT